MPHSGKDNLNFYFDAVAFAHGELALPSGPHSRWWSWAISWLFRAFGESLWLGYAVNQWVFFFASVQFVRFYQDLNGKRGRWLALLIFGLIPASLLYSNLLFRESFQILMLIIIVRHLERYRRSGSFASLGIASVAFIPFGAIHNGFFLYAPMAIGLALIARILSAPASRRFHFSTPQIQASIVAAVLVTGTASMLLVFSEHRRVEQIMSGNLNLGSIIEQTEDEGARTTLPWRPGEGLANEVLFVPVQATQFLFAPIFPFMVERPEDAVAAVDTAARIAMLFGVFLLWRKSSKEGRKTILFLMALYLAFVVLASLGTRTSGAAMRHNLKMFWLIAALGTAGLPRLVMRSTQNAHAMPDPAASQT